MKNQTTDHTSQYNTLSMPELLTEKEAAKLLKKHPRWLERKRWEGGGPAFRYVGKTPVYEETDVINWLQSIPKITNTSQIFN